MPEPSPALAHRRRRLHLIRTRVVAGAAALFVAVFGGITVQLASGHDPALSATSKKSTPGTTSAATTAQQQTTTQRPATPKQPASTTLSPVTTRQS